MQLFSASIRKQSFCRLLVTACSLAFATAALAQQTDSPLAKDSLEKSARVAKQKGQPLAVFGMTDT